MRRQKEWIVRLTEQAKSSTDCYFVTLTYNEQSVPWGSAIPILDKKGIQLFMKRLRKSLQPGIKYYLVGEYGTNTKRPHYHMIIFNTGVNLEKLKLKIIEAWTTKNEQDEKQLLGNIDVGYGDISSMTYVAKYLIKDDKIDYEVKPFALMSKGLGSRYIDKRTSWHQEDLSRNYSVMQGGKKFPLPKYYKQKMLNEDQRLRMTAKSKAQIEKDAAKSNNDNPALQTQRNEAFRRMLENRNKQKSKL